MDCLPISQFSLNFLLTSKTYLKDGPPSAGIVNRNFQLAKGCGEIGLHTLQAANFIAAPWFALVRGA